MVNKILNILFLSIALSLTASGQLMKAKEIFSRADSLRGTLSPLRTCYDIKYYHLDIRVDIPQRYISGQNLFRFEALEDFDQLQFDLFDNLSVDRVLYRGEPLSFSRDGHAVFVEFPNHIPKGRLDSFIVEYSGHPVQATRAPWDGGFDWKTDSQGKPWVATAVQGLGASAWWPNKDHLSDEPDSMLISVAVPNEVMNVSNGRLVKTEKIGGGFTKYHWKVRSPINNYNIALNIGDYAHFEDIYPGEKGPLTVDYYVLKENKEHIAHLKKNVHQTLEAFEHWFGPYPFYEDGYKLVEAPHLGMEHQSAVAYGNGFANGYRGQDLSGSGWGKQWDFIIIHESGHEWFANNITTNDIADMWVHEGFTNYSETLFTTCEFGVEAGNDYCIGTRSRIQNDIPIIGHYGVNNEGSGDMYYKGGNLLHTVRQIINNDSLFRQILRGLNSTFYHKTVDSRDVEAYISKQCGKDLSKVFDQYLRTVEVPVLEYKVNGNQLQYRWTQCVEGFNMPLKVQFGGEKWITPTTNWQTLSVGGAGSPSFTVDRNFYIRLKKTE